MPRGRVVGGVRAGSVRAARVPHISACCVFGGCSWSTPAWRAGGPRLPRCRQPLGSAARRRGSSAAGWQRTSAGLVRSLRWRAHPTAQWRRHRVCVGRSAHRQPDGGATNFQRRLSGQQALVIRRIAVSGQPALVIRRIAVSGQPGLVIRRIAVSGQPALVIRRIAVSGQPALVIWRIAIRRRAGGGGSLRRQPVRRAASGSIRRQPVWRLQRESIWRQPVRWLRAAAAAQAGRIGQVEIVGARCDEGSRSR